MQPLPEPWSLRQLVLDEAKTFRTIDEYFEAHEAQVERRSGRSLGQQKAIVMLSGGPDSTFLLYYLWAKAIFGEVVALHVNYKLRNNLLSRSSDKDAKFVKALCEQLNIPCWVRERPIALASGNVQAEARRIRYEEARSLANQLGIGFVMTAHHADDVVETFVVKLLQKAGLQALGRFAEPKPHPKSPTLRPMTKVFKEEIVGFLRRSKLPYRTDRSNRKMVYLRTFVRRRIAKPLFRRNPLWRQHLLQVSNELNQDFGLIRHLIKQCFWFDEQKQYTLVKKAFFGLSNLEQRALLGHALKVFFEGRKTFARKSLEQMVRSMSQTEERILFRLGSVDFAYSFGLVYPKSRPQEAVFVPLEGAKTIGDQVLSLKRSAFGVGASSASETIFRFSTSQPINEGIWVRQRQDGDKLRLRPERKPTPLADLLGEEKIPKHLRDNAFVVECNKILIGIFVPKSPLTQRLRSNGWVKKEGYAWVDSDFWPKNDHHTYEIGVGFLKK